MVAVQATTDAWPELRDLLADRQRRGLDRYDEWWQGVYRVVTGPTPEHGELVLELGSLLGPVVREAGLRQAAPVNIGSDKHDCRVPDLGVYRSDTRRTSPAFLATAVLVVEILSPGERSGSKLDFYAAWAVQEYLEIDLAKCTAELYVSRWQDENFTDFAGWDQVTDSEHLDFGVRMGRTRRGLVAGRNSLDLRRPSG
jgi:Uma2 family endonuclease